MDRALNLDQAVSRVQRLFGDDFEVQIKVTDVVDWVNESIMTIARETECFTATQTANYGAATLGLALNTDFIGERRITWDGVPLDRTEITSIDNLGLFPSDVGGSPTHFYFHDSKIWLYPQPTATKSLVIAYVQAPAVISDMTAQLPVPIFMHNDVCRMAMIRARELNEDFDQAARLQQEVDASLGKSRDDQQNKARETFPVVKDDPSDWSY